MAPIKRKVSDLKNGTPDSVIGFNTTGEPVELPKTEFKGDRGPAGADSNAAGTGDRVTNILLKYKTDLVPKKNMFDKDSAKPGRMIADGQIPTTESTSRYYSEFIPVTPLTDYYNNEVAEFVNFFDVDTNHISNFDETNIRGFSTPENCMYVVLTGYLSSIDTMQLEPGVSGTTYGNFELVTQASQVEVNKSQIVFDQKITKNDTDFLDVYYEPTQNIFNKDGTEDPQVNGHIIRGARVLAAGTVVTGDANNDLVRNFEIPATIKKLTFSRYASAAFSDADGNHIIGDIVSGSNKTVDVPEGAKFVTYQIAKTNLDTLMVNSGSEPQEYAAHTTPKVTINDFAIAAAENGELPVNIILPQVITCSTGMTMELYNSALVPVNNYNNFEYRWSTDAPRGVNLERNFSIEADTPGTYTLSVVMSQLSLAGKVVKLGEASTSLVVTTKLTGAKTININPIGDSLTDQKEHIPQVNDSDSPFQYVGTRYFSTNTGDPDPSNPNRHDGRGGTASLYYLSDLDHQTADKGETGNDGRTGEKNPYFNPATGDVDFNYYLSNYNKTVDMIRIHLGINNRFNVSQEIGRLKSFVDKLKATGAAGKKIFIVTHPRMGRKAGSVDIQGDMLRVHDIYTTILSTFENETDVIIIPHTLHFDWEYNYRDTVLKPANPFSEVMIPADRENIHPSNYLQMGNVDIQYYTYAQTL